MKVQEEHIDFLKECGLYGDSFFSNDFYHQCLHRARQEKLFNKSHVVNIGYYGVGGESDKILIPEDLEQKLINGSRLSIRLYNLLAALRHMIAIFARLYVDFKIIRHSKRNYKHKEANHKRLVIIRSLAQQDHARKTFGGAENTVLINAPSRLASMQNLESNIELSYATYFRGLVSWCLGRTRLCKNNPVIDNINFSYALTELDLANILQQQIYFALTDVSGDKLKVLYTYEVLSKDALMDAKIACKKNAKCYHLRIVEVAFKETPFVVAGNRALVRNDWLQTSYRRFWSGDATKFKKVSFFFRALAKDLPAEADTILICTSAINVDLNHQFIKSVVHANRGKKFHVRFHPRLLLDIDGLGLDDVDVYNPRMEYQVVYTWPSSVIDEYWSEEAIITVFRPNISPYKYQDSHFYSLPNVAVISALDELR